MIADRISLNMTLLLKLLRMTFTEKIGSTFRDHALGEMQGSDDEVDCLDADKRNDDAADAVDHQVMPLQRAGPYRAIRHALQSQGNQPDDDPGVEDDGEQDGALRG